MVGPTKRKLNNIDNADDCAHNAKSLKTSFEKEDSTENENESLKKEEVITMQSSSMDTDSSSEIKPEIPSPKDTGSKNEQQETAETAKEIKTEDSEIKKESSLENSGEEQISSESKKKKKVQPSSFFGI